MTNWTYFILIQPLWAAELLCSSEIIYHVLISLKSKQDSAFIHFEICECFVQMHKRYKCIKTACNKKQVTINTPCNAINVCSKNLCFKDTLYGGFDGSVSLYWYDYIDSFIVSIYL